MGVAQKVSGWGRARRSGKRVGRGWGIEQVGKIMERVVGRSAERVGRESGRGGRESRKGW